MRLSIAMTRTIPPPLSDGLPNSTARNVLTSNYILVESSALVQHRLGLEALRVFFDDVIPVLNVHWISEHEHRAAMAALVVASRRKLSLVDCTSFEVMRRLGLSNAYAFDRHFIEQGFDVQR